MVDHLKIAILLELILYQHRIILLLVRKSNYISDVRIMKKVIIITSGKMYIKILPHENPTLLDI